MSVDAQGGGEEAAAHAAAAAVSHVNHNRLTGTLRRVRTKIVVLTALGVQNPLGEREIDE